MWAPATGSTYSLGSVTQEIVGKNLRLFPILFKQFRHLQYAFFDVKQLAGEAGLSLKMKEVQGVESTLTVDGVSVKWLDYALFDFTTTVGTSATYTYSTADITLPVVDGSGFSVNDTIYIVGDLPGTRDQVDGIVKSISGNTLTITVTRKNGGAIGTDCKLTTAQNIERGFWRRNDNDEILRPASSYNYKEYHSYIQHFSRRIEFTKQEMNKEYKYEGEAKAEASKRFSYNIAILIQELNKAIYKGRNVAPGSGALDKMEMLGLETVCQASGSIADLTSSTTPVKDLFAELELAFRSGAIMGEEPLMLLVNDKFLSNLASSHGDKVRYDHVVDSIKYEVPKLTTIFGAVDIIRDPMLNRLYNYPVAFAAPRSLIKLWVRENQKFEPKGGVTKADQSIQVYPVIHNLREKELFDIEFEMGGIYGGLSASECPFRMITNFAGGEA